LGYVTPDGVLCTGDAILSPAMAQYSKMPYFEDIGKAIESLNRLLQTDYPYYALAHMEIIEKRDLPGLVKKNLALLERIHVEMLELINDPVTLDELVSSVMYGLGIRFGNETRNAYLKTTISSRVKYLVETGRLRRIEEDGVIRYGKVQRSIYGE
jgi:glyoxylase-like metal-dependent hydrolase (beta-lactamase superfamily II)